MQAPGGIVFRRAQSLSKKGEPFINGEEGCVRETREGCPHDDDPHFSELLKL